MKIFIVGLGLMGASYAKGLFDFYEINGFDNDELSCQKAINSGLIKSCDLRLLETSDLVILALYPKDNITFVKENIGLFKKQIVTDLSGTKEWMIEELEKILPKTVDYVSHHPMAGKEKSGYDYHDNKMFLNANFLLVPTKLSKEEGIEKIESLAKMLGFGKITSMTAQEHDELIAFTSQLTHVLAVSLVNSDTHKHTKTATGDSYRDLTRIAKINEVMWTELFLENKEKLIFEMDKLIKEISLMKHLIQNDEKEALMRKLKASREKREDLDRN